MREDQSAYCAEYFGWEFGTYAYMKLFEIVLLYVTLYWNCSKIWSWANVEPNKILYSAISISIKKYNHLNCGSTKKWFSEVYAFFTVYLVFYFIKKNGFEHWWIFLATATIRSFVVMLRNLGRSISIKSFINCRYCHVRHGCTMMKCSNYTIHYILHTNTKYNHPIHS